MRAAHRLAVSLGPVLLAFGCMMYDASVYVRPPEEAPSFTQREQDRAEAIIVEISRSAGFWETDTAEKLSEHPSSRPYFCFVSLGAPGGSLEQRSISILGDMRQDRREIRVSVGDYTRGEPPPSIQKLIDDLRTALERAFPDHGVTVTNRKVVRWFAP